MANVRDNFLRNTVWNYVGFVVNLAVNLFLFPLAIARMGDAATGIWLLIGSVSGYMGLLQLGLAPAMAQYAAGHITRRDADALSQTVSTALVLVMALGLLPLLALPAIPWLLELFSIPADLRAEAAVAFQLGIIGVPLQMPGHVFNGVLGASQRQDRCTHVWMVSLTGKLVGIALLLGAGYGLAEIMWLETALILLADALLAKMAFTAAPDLRIGLGDVSPAVARQLLGLGGWNFANSMTSMVIEQSDRIIIGLYLTVVAVTQYSAAWKLYMLLYSVATTLVQAVWPAAAALHAVDDRDGLRRLWLRMTKYTLAVAWPMACSLALCAGPILELWVGRSYAEHHHVVVVLVACFLIAAHNHAGYGVLSAMRLIGPVVRRYALPQAVLNLGLSLWLIQPLGILGVAIGTLVPLAVLQGPFFALVLRAIDLPWRDVWHKVVVPTAAPALWAFGPLVGLYVVVGPFSMWLLPAAAAGCVGYGALMWLGMEEAERRDLTVLLPAPMRAVFRT